MKNTIVCVHNRIDHLDVPIDKYTISILGQVNVIVFT